jgi:uncharacterized protein YjiS (DUF1127 family)
MMARTATGYRPESGSAARAGPGVVLSGILVLAQRAGWGLWRWYQVHQTTRQLSALPDHMLNDIGLSRSMLLSATINRVREEEASRRGAWW